MIGAKGTTVVERTFGMDLSLGVGTTLAIVFGSLAAQAPEARTTWQLTADNLFTKSHGLDGEGLPRGRSSCDRSRGRRCSAQRR